MDSVAADCRCFHFALEDKESVMRGWAMRCLVICCLLFAAGVPGMGIVMVGCIACFIGGWIIIAKEMM